ncbi:hypothetical protein LCGC14_0791330 [marine sediment metagenome]|uniref:Uncharacterized protein n=1 Tax=marine sediment metagenome TaxID=412755 RepID=A0A0F9PWS8_9ZZZZ|nr:MAG: hypothetical protein Lokiarch_21560 [Candidatus Lokiarchaeum sp. GC14_75]
MRTIKPVNKFKTYKYDSAPFFFFIDIFPSIYDNEGKPNLIHLINAIDTNPIMPIPMRVDRVFNGGKSVLIRPREPISFPISEEETAIINPLPFIQLGFEKLLFFTEVRAREKFFLSLTMDRVLKWWNLTKYQYGKLATLEEDFSAFSRAYLHTVLKAKIFKEDLTKAAKNYCEIISEVCRKRLERNSIFTEVHGNEENVKMYKVKETTFYKKFKKVNETQYHPELIDIEIWDLIQNNFSTKQKDLVSKKEGIKTTLIKYIPLLFYDDLLECMLQNIKKIEDGEGDLLDPSFLLDHKVITTLNSKELDPTNLGNYSWWNSFEGLEFEPILHSINKSHESFINTYDPKESIRNIR